MSTDFRNFSGSSGFFLSTTFILSPSYRDSLSFGSISNNPDVIVVQSMTRVYTIWAHSDVKTLHSGCRWKRKTESLWSFLIFLGGCLEPHQGFLIHLVSQNFEMLRLDFSRDKPSVCSVGGVGKPGLGEDCSPLAPWAWLPTRPFVSSLCYPPAFDSRCFSTHGLCRVNSCASHSVAVSGQLGGNASACNIYGPGSSTHVLISLVCHCFLSLCPVDDSLLIWSLWFWLSVGRERKRVRVVNLSQLTWDSHAP